MVEILIGFIIFCIILFLYIHIQFHLKTSNDLEIYEIDQASKNTMEEICDLRQPVLFDCTDEETKILTMTSKAYLTDNYPIFEVKIRECNQIENDNSELYIPLALHVANKLFVEDKKSTYFTESNADFLAETGTLKTMSYNDIFLRPNMVSNCNYDILMGSTNAKTPFKYELNYRNYFTVTQGSIVVKLSPPISSKYLYPIHDYENLEFRSQVNPWNPQPKFRADFDKIKCLEITLIPGKFLFIPAYWWYSFSFDDNTSVSCFKYRTYMNNIAISPNIFMYALQNLNIQRNSIKKCDIKTLNVNQNVNQNVNEPDKDSINETDIDYNTSTNIKELPIENNIPDILRPNDTNNIGDSGHQELKLTSSLSNETENNSYL